MLDQELPFRVLQFQLSTEKEQHYFGMPRYVKHKMFWKLRMYIVSVFNKTGFVMQWMVFAIPRRIKHYRDFEIEGGVRKL